MKIELTSEQIIDLMMEKKITLGNMEISVKNTFLGTLSQLDLRLQNGKAINFTNPTSSGRRQQLVKIY